MSETAKQEAMEKFKHLTIIERLQFSHEVFSLHINDDKLDLEQLHNLTGLYVTALMEVVLAQQAQIDRLTRLVMS